MVIEQMVEQLSTLGRRRTDKLIWESVLYYYGSILLNKYKFRKSTGSSTIKYYTIIFASSGIGKGWAVHKTEELFNLSTYSAIMMKNYLNSIAPLSERPSDADEMIRYMPKSTTIGVEGTAEGLYQVTQSQKASDFGSLNLLSEEL